MVGFCRLFYEKIWDIKGLNYTMHFIININTVGNFILGFSCIFLAKNDKQKLNKLPAIAKLNLGENLNQGI